MIQAVIFDMDGTLLNTITDLTLSTNYALKETGHPSGFSEDLIKLCFGWAMRLDMIKALALSKGVPKEDLEKAGTDISIEELSITEKEINDMTDIFTSHYAIHHFDHTKPYPGIMDLLFALQEKNIATAIASNKDDLQVKALADFLFPSLFQITKGQHPGISIKPSPSMIWEIAEEMGIKKRNILYVGDSEVDILTGKRGDFPTVSVTWGFRNRKFLEKKEASWIIDHPLELLPLISLL